MECLHSSNTINIDNINEEVVVENDGLSIMPVNNEDTIISLKSQIDDNNSKQSSSSVTDLTLDNNESLSTTTRIIQQDDRSSPTNQHILYENQHISNRSSPINNNLNLSKLNSMSSLKSFETKRIDAALEKNLETIVTQVRRTTIKPSQLTKNDLELFDSTSSTNDIINHHSRNMTPDSINQESIQNEQYYHRSIIPPSTIDPYGQPLWPPGIYPFVTHQHPGLYLPYPPTNNTLPSFYPSYDPLLIEQHYSPHVLSAYYTQQQAVAARLFQEHASLSDNISSTLTTTPTKEHSENSPSISDDSIKLSDLVTNENQKKNIVINKSFQSYQHNRQTINGSLSRLSPDLLSDDGDDGRINDTDSIISLDSIKSNIAASMPVLEDGLSDSENINNDEQSPSIIKKSNSRHQSTQSDLLFDSNHLSLIPTHQHHSTKTINNEYVSQTKSSYNCSTVCSSNIQIDQHKISLHECSSIQTDNDTDEETDKLLNAEQRVNTKYQAIHDAAVSKSSRAHEVVTRIIADPENSSVLIEGVLFRCRYLGSTQLPVEGNPTKISRMMQAQEAVERIKAPYGESQPSVEVDLFISTEKIMVLNTDLEDILMDHSLRSISYIADIGDLVVLMAKRRYIQNENNINSNDDSNGITATTRRVVSINQKMICHIFESDEAPSIANSIGQAFQVAYIEFLKANGIDDPNFTCDINYQEVLDQQEIDVEELDRFAKKECQKEAIVTKGKNEPLGIVIVESGWGSMLPTVVIANMMPGGPAARGGQLNIGDQIISVNGISMVGLPLSNCQAQIKNMKHLTTVRLVVVPCPPVVEVLIRRPDTKYQLGFSVQNGIICSLLRGGIAERGGVRVGHRIIEINGQSVVGTRHERIVSMLSNSIGELRMKTMPTQIYRLLTGQETPIYI
ncbi:unnamed protein product [Rotaria sordida]|uniref:Uncharacterized protein n=1 Tax=Rotaria sordida TaxID=392033 RepID=A0A815P0X7_9BILA|nr:unnamed protein product [Rotaria sordida]CAF1442430.1 unnamed protein product [Rotaria sordida]